MDGLSGLFVPKQQRGGALRDSGEKFLSSPKLESVFREVQKAIHDLKEGSVGCKVLLVVDQLDLLLAAGGEGVGAVGLGEMLMELREVCATFHGHCVTGLINCLGGTRNCHLSLGGSTTGSYPANTFGGQSCCILIECGPRCRFHDGLAAAGYGNC